jgi:AcrR family transcriptional regulator
MLHTSDRPVKGEVVGRERLVQAASSLFAQRGFYGVSVSDVANEAGVVKSAIYHHFESKEDLYVAVLQETARQSREQLEASAQGRTWQIRLRGATRALGALLGPRSHVLSLIVGRISQLPMDSDPKIAETIANFRMEFGSVFLREIQTGIADGDLRHVNPYVAAACLIGVVAGALQGDVELPEAERLDLAFDLFIRGIEKRKK